MTMKQKKQSPRGTKSASSGTAFCLSAISSKTCFPGRRTLLLCRLLSKLGRPKLYFEFPIGFDEALEYKKAHGQYLRRNQWQDLTVHVYI